MKKNTRTTTFLATLPILFFAINVYSQSNDSHAKMKAGSDKKPFMEIVNQALTDSSLINQKIKIVELTFAPGQIDTVSHRHGAEIFLYVVEGSFEYRLGNNKSVIYKKGQVIHEPPYSLHTLSKNPSQTRPAKLLLIAVQKEGTPFYIREYPEKKE